MKKIEDEKNLDQKKILLRLDLNVPIQDGIITDSTRIDKILPILSEVDIGSPIDTKNSQIKKYIKGTKRYKIISYDISSLAISSSASEIFLVDGLKNNSRRGISKKASKIGAYVKIPVELNEIYAKNGIERVRKYFKNLNFIFRKIKQIY